MGDSARNNKLPPDNFEQDSDRDFHVIQDMAHPQENSLVSSPRGNHTPGHTLHRQKSCLRSTTSRTCSSSSSTTARSSPSATSTTELADHCRSARKGVRFSDGSSPGRQITPEDERRKVPCYEPSPQAVSSSQLDIPEESWSDMLKQASDIHSLKQLLDQTSLSTDSADNLLGRGRH